MPERPRNWNGYACFGDVDYGLRDNAVDIHWANATGSIIVFPGMAYSGPESNRPDHSIRDTLARDDVGVLVEFHSNTP